MVCHLSRMIRPIPRTQRTHTLHTHTHYTHTHTTHTTHTHTQYIHTLYITAILCHRIESMVAERERTFVCWGKLAWSKRSAVPLARVSLYRFKKRVLSASMLYTYTTTAGTLSSCPTSLHTHNICSIDCIYYIVLPSIQYCIVWRYFATEHIATIVIESWRTIIISAQIIFTTVFNSCVCLLNIWRANQH